MGCKTKKRAAAASGSHEETLLARSAPNTSSSRLLGKIPRPLFTWPPDNVHKTAGHIPAAPPLRPRLNNARKSPLLCAAEQSSSSSRRRIRKGRLIIGQMNLTEIK